MSPLSLQVEYFKRIKNKLFADITAVPVVAQGSYYPSLDGLRGIAILMVLWYHLGANHYTRPFHILINGDFGVDIFFVISGFLITTLLLKEKIKYGNISFRRFFTRRALRIIPGAYLFLIVLIILNVVYKFRIPAPAFLASFLFYKNFPYLQEPYSGHFWSLATEIQFYLIFPILLASSVNRYMVILSVIVVLIPALSILGHYHAGFLSTVPFSHLATRITMYAFWNGPFIILIGSLASVFLFKGMIRIDPNGGSYFLSFALLLTAIITTSTSFWFYSPYISEFIAALLVAGSILLNLGRKSLLTVILTNPALVKVGVISYSLYIWQQPFLGRKAWQPWMLPFRALPPDLFMMIKLILVFLIAFASYHLVERSFLTIKTRFERTPKLIKEN